MQSLFSHLFSLVFPSSCAGCDAPGVPLCDECVRTLPFADPIDQSSSSITQSHMYAVYDYAHPLVQRAIHDLKYHRKRELVSIVMSAAIPHMHEYISERLQSMEPQRLLLVPIPQHAQKTAERGFNQSALLANKIARSVSGARVYPCLKKIRSTISQATLKKKYERLSNLSHSMEAAHDLDPQAVYVVIDDVTTTGATFIEASRALRARGAVFIACIALSHGFAHGFAHGFTHSLAHGFPDGIARQNKIRKN